MNKMLSSVKKAVINYCHLFTVGLTISKQIFSAYQGLIFWHKVNKTPGINNTEVLLFPDDDVEVHKLATRHLREYLQSIRADNCIILTNDKNLINSDLVSNPLVLKVMKSTKKENNALLSLYCLYEFAPNLTIVSLNYPKGRAGERILRDGKVTKEEAFLYGVYKLRKYRGT